MSEELTDKGIWYNIKNLWNKMQIFYIKHQINSMEVVLQTV